MKTEISNKNFTWINLVNPSSEEFTEIVKKYEVHETSVEDCLDPEHLPKIEKFDRHYFIISRYFDPQAKTNADTTQELTRKIACFIGEKFIITIQRTEPYFWPSLVKDSSTAKDPWEVYLNIGYKVVESYNQILTTSENFLEDIESRLFHHNTGTSTLQKVHLVKRKHSILKHLFSQMQVSHFKIPLTKSLTSPVQDLKEEFERINFKNQSVIEEASGLLQLYLSISSHRTNESVRVLTVFSVFFMPLTFVAGIYGMNFKYMPEIDHPYGYLGVWIIFILLTIGLYFWFKRKKIL